MLLNWCEFKFFGNGLPQYYRTRISNIPIWSIWRCLFVSKRHLCNQCGQASVLLKYNYAVLSFKKFLLKNILFFFKIKKSKSIPYLIFFKSIRMHSKVFWKSKSRFQKSPWYSKIFTVWCCSARFPWKWILYYVRLGLSLSELWSMRAFFKCRHNFCWKLKKLTHILIIFTFEANVLN